MSRDLSTFLKKFHAEALRQGFYENPHLDIEFWNEDSNKWFSKIQVIRVDSNGLVSWRRPLNPNWSRAETTSEKKWMTNPGDYRICSVVHPASRKIRVNDGLLSTTLRVMKETV